MSFFNHCQSIAINTKVSLEATSVDSGYVLVCAFIVADSRTGKWNEELPNDRFAVSDNYFTFEDGNVVGKMYSYCKTLPEPPTPSPTSNPTRVVGESVTYTFPKVNTSQFVHGICVIGADTASASSTDAKLKYTAVPDFKNGVQLWNDRSYVSAGIQGADKCEGGIFLRPTLHKVSFEPAPSADLAIALFLLVR